MYPFGTCWSKASATRTTPMVTIRIAISQGGSWHPRCHAGVLGGQTRCTAVVLPVASRTSGQLRASDSVRGYASQTPSHFPNPDSPSRGVPCMPSPIMQSSQFMIQSSQFSESWIDSTMEFPHAAAGRRPAAGWGVASCRTVGNPNTAALGI